MNGDDRPLVVDKPVEAFLRETLHDGDPNFEEFGRKSKRIHWLYPPNGKFYDTAPDAGSGLNKRQVYHPSPLGTNRKGVPMALA